MPVLAVSDVEYDQAAADAAYAFLALEKARQAGTVTGGPPVDAVRAMVVLQECARRGIRPRPESVTELLSALLKG